MIASLKKIENDAKRISLYGICCARAYERYTDVVAPSSFFFSFQKVTEKDLSVLCQSLFRTANKFGSYRDVKAEDFQYKLLL